ncbi:MAG: NAD-dependent epimerase/dehydratase family protein [Nanoarchaeota archaeon]|nr:NAD-dependent epimerase/dehydratase family protein [Nanoarchaeota archaeon]
MNYAITGHKGLIGDFLKRRLDKEGYNCVLQIDQREGFNVMDLMFKETELNDKIDIFFHFAAQCRINEAIAKPILPHKNNVDGIFSVLEFCKKQKIPKVVVASTSRILSKERNPYVASKAYVEELTKAYHDCYGIDYIIVRPSTVYGPIYDETSRLINNFLSAAFKGEDLKIYGTEEKTLDFTYVDDFVEGVILAVQKNGWNQTYNISGENETRIFDLAKEVIEQTESKSKIIFLPEEKAQPQKVKVDISELTKIGYKPKVDIQEGVKKMVEFYKQNPNAWKNYIDKGAEYYDTTN